MNNEQMIRELGRLSRQESVPAVEVSLAVMRRTGEAGQVTNKPLAVITGLSAVAAAIVLYFAADVWSSWQDPIAGLLSSVETVLQ
jgi:hypothetical protein